MIDKPARIPGLRICLALTKSGLTAYGNREAFSALGAYMRFIEEAPDDEYYECHFVTFLEDDETRFEGKRPRNVAVLFEKDLAQSFPHRSTNDIGFELTLMKVPNADLDEMDKYQADAILPDDWNKHSDDEGDPEE